MDDHKARGKPLGFDIVVIDQDEGRRRHLRENVAPRTNHRWTYIESGEEFIRRLETGEVSPLPRIILTALGERQGAQLVRTIRQEHKYLDESPVIVITSGNAHDPAKDAAAAAGANIWIGEPVTHYAIDAALQEFTPGRFIVEWVDRNPPAADGVIQAG